MVIKIEIQGEPFETEKEQMTPDEIILLYGEKELACYLTQIKGRQRFSYRYKMDKPLYLRDGMKFQIVYLGPCTKG